MTRSRPIWLEGQVVAVKCVVCGPVLIELTSSGGLTAVCGLRGACYGSVDLATPQTDLTTCTES